MRHLAFAALLLIATNLPQSRAAEEGGASSLDQLAAVTKKSFEQKDPAALLNNYFSKGTPADVLKAITNSIADICGKGEWIVTDVQTIPFKDYESTTGVPGEYNRKKLAWLLPPSHWIILKAEQPKGDVPTFLTMKLEFAVAQKEKRWWLLGVRFAD